MIRVANAPSVVTASPLARYDAACKAVAAAATVDEVRDISALADAQRAYAKQAKNRQMEVQAAEIRIRAERRLGELMAEQAATIGLAKGAAEAGTNRGTTRVENKPASLAEAGIDKNLAHRARTYAAVPEEKFEKMLAAKRERDNRAVTLDPDFQAEAEAAARDIEIERDERIAMAGADHLVKENEKLTQQVATLSKRVASLIDENRSLQYREKLWKERAVSAGWKARVHA
jgi:hypothetical protein